MTCVAKYFLEHPGKPVVGCPQDYGYIPERPKDCYLISCFKDCWAREVTGGDKSNKKYKRKD